MSYTHTGRKQVKLTRDPIDVDGQDWFFFSYGDWLRTNETISAHEALVEGGTIVTDSVDVGDVVDTDGVTRHNCYGVEISVGSGVSEVILTHRVTTTLMSGLVDIGRTDIDRSIIIPVRVL